MIPSPAAPARPDRIDLAIGGGLMAASLLYLWALPRTLGASDEAYYLYHARRMLEGEVLYRDIFDYTTPLFVDLTAILFRLFGMTIDVARMWAGAIQAGIVGAIYGVCRAAGVRRELAVVAALTHLAVAQPVWSVASPHWLSTLLMLGIVAAALDRTRARTIGGMFLQGTLVGALVATQQHKGGVMAFAVAALLLLDWGLDRRYGPAPGPGLLVRLVALVSGTLAVAGTVLGLHAAYAGVRPMVHQLGLYPFQGYARYNVGAASWGRTFIPGGPAPGLLARLIVAVPLGLVPAGALWWARRDRARLERILVSSVLALAAACSVLYFPDAIHLAFLAPLLLEPAARVVEGVLGWCGRWNRSVGWAASAVGFVLLVRILHASYVSTWAANRFASDTAFGHIHFATEGEAQLADMAYRTFASSTSKELFCYPAYAALYLMTGARNPTPHEIIMPVYHDDAELTGVIEVLERQAVRYVFLLPALLRTPDTDPVAAYIRAHYRCGPAGGWCERIGAPPA